MATKTKVERLLALITELEDEELVEVRFIITSTLNLRRSIGVLNGQLERPGRRGRRWAKPKEKKRERK